MVKRQVGNRRSEKELEELRIKSNKLSFELIEQKNFKGSDKQLEMMQTFERAYIDGAPIISDEEWDILKNKYNYEESLVSTSPSGRSWVKMFSPLPSINKASNLNELNNFLAMFDDNQIFKVEGKLDGLTANVRYVLKNNLYIFDCITSRGNGRYGLKLNPYALAGVKKNWPDTIELKYVQDILECDEKELPKYFELRGEAVIPKNKHTYEKYGKNSVWRSIASGMFNRKVPFNLNGVINYCFDGQETLESLMNNNSEILFQGIFKGRKCLNPKIFEITKLIASLFEEKDPDKFTKYDSIKIEKDFKVTIFHENGNAWSGYDDGEELDIVFYSVSIKDSNIDSKKIRNIPNIKYISDIEWELNEFNNISNIPKTYRETADRSSILQAIFDFYGTDNNGKRDLKKPRLRNMCEYALDGVIIKPINSNRETQGLYFRNHKNNTNKIICPKYPEDQIAVKLLSEVVKVKLEKIEYTETELGNVTCSGILDKPYLTESGSIVERINLHNPEWLDSNSWIKEGEFYDMIMALDIIPTLINPDL